MQRTCDGTDPNLIGEDGQACNCGLTFDDVGRLVIYPHTEIRKPTPAELQEAMAALGLSG
jgi:hypothetical protein